mmetsp:Transcript_27073/g.63363  ORF Transcript_27073/g.63363 Transcript_27073/m.63363 type:complete len:138 (+) Transcript_27073:534-947(+)
MLWYGVVGGDSCKSLHLPGWLIPTFCKQRIERSNHRGHEHPRDDHDDDRDDVEDAFHCEEGNEAFHGEEDNMASEEDHRDASSKADAAGQPQRDGGVPSAEEQRKNAGPICLGFRIAALSSPTQNLWEEEKKKAWLL